MPRARQRIALVNVAAYRVSLIAKHKLLRWTNLTEVLDRIDAHERTSRTILFTRVRLAPRTGRIKRRVFAKIALDRNRIIRRLRRRQRIIPKAENLSQLRNETIRRRRCSTRHHCDRVVRTLRRAIEAADTRVRIDFDLTYLIAKDRTRRTTSHTLRIRAVHTDLRH